MHETWSVLQYEQEEQNGCIDTTQNTGLMMGLTKHLNGWVCELTSESERVKPRRHSQQVDRGTTDSHTNTTSNTCITQQ